MSKILSEKHGYKIDPNQELRALGLANITGSFFQSYPTSGGFSRTAVNESPSSNRYIYSIIAQDDDQDGIVPFVIDYTDLNGNDYGDISTTTDTSYVRFDGTNPVFPVVSISSNGADSTLAGANDTIVLTFRIHEPVSDSSVIILNNPANSIIALNNNYFRAKYGINGSESEGRVSFLINASN